MPASLSVEGTRKERDARHEAVYRIHIGSGANEAAFGFQYYLPSWRTGEPVLGSPIGLFSVELTGAGSIEPAASGPVPPPVRIHRDVCRRERASPLSNDYWVQVPPHSNAIVELRAKGTYPAWPSASYRLRFSTFSINDWTAPRTPLATVSTRPLWSKGTHIQLQVVKGPSDNPRFSPELVGRTSPPLRFGRIALRAVRPERSGSVYLEDWLDPRPPAASLGAVLTDRHGRFRVVPRPLRTSGRYAVIARSEARGKRAADWNCGAFFRID
jgi:hypothetical protein